MHIKSHTFLCCSKHNTCISSILPPSTKNIFHIRAIDFLPAELILRYQNVTTAPRAGSRGGSRADGPSEQTQVCSRPDPVTANVKEMTTRVCVCVGGNFIRSTTAGNHWQVDWGLGTLWHKDFKGICFHRDVTFLWGKHSSKAEAVLRNATTFSKSFTGFEKNG